METSTLTALLKQAAETFPSRPAVTVFGNLTLTHSDLDRLVDSTASLLLSSGLTPGDVVALTFPNTVELVVLFLAVVRSRAVAAPLNQAYTQEEFELYLSDSGAKRLITGKGGNAAASAAAAKLNIPCSHAVLKNPSGTVEISPLDLRSDGGEEKLGVTAESDVALFLHTSGTTSRPKGVPLTQRNLAATVRNITLVYELTETDSTVVVLPLFHVHGLVAGLLSSLAAGAAVTLPASGRFSASTFWSDMKSSNATWYTAVPTIHQIILDRHGAKPEDSYPKLRFIRSCSASLAPVILERLETAFDAPVLEAYAMTEAAHLMTSNPLPKNGPHKAGTVGKAVGSVEMGVLDEEGNVLPANVKGEVCVRGPNVTMGYRNNDEANEVTFKFGWFHTGDIGFVDDDGYLCLVGRIKELINRGGEKISPIEVDAVLLLHPEIAQAVSFGVPDDKYGEEINCAVIPKKGSKMEVDEVLGHCKKNLAAFKVPKRVFFTDSLPKTATGKIQRRIVAEHFLAQIPAANVPKSGA